MDLIKWKVFLSNVTVHKYFIQINFVKLFKWTLYYRPSLPLAPSTKIKAYNNNRYKVSPISSSYFASPGKGINFCSIAWKYFCMRVEGHRRTFYLMSHKQNIHCFGHTCEACNAKVIGHIGIEANTDFKGLVACLMELEERHQSLLCCFLHRLHF